MCKTNIRNIYKRIKIGVIMETLEESCQSKIWHGISDCASKKNIDVILFLGTLQIGIFDREMHYDVINDFITINDLDGLIILSGAISHYYDINKIKAICDKQSSIPVVSLSLKIDGVKSVVINNKIGMEEIVDHLINIHNCKRIAFIKGPEGQDEADDRFEAYCTTLKKNNIPLEEELIIPGNFIEESGEEAVNKLIQECKVKFDAIVAIDDFTAIGAIAALKELGLRIPEDVLVTGFDDIDESNILSPPITTVKQPFYEQGQKSVELVLDMIKWDSVEDVTSLPTKLVIRQSCGCSVKEKVLIEEEELRKIYYKNKMKDYKTWKLQTVCEKLDNIIKFDTLMDVMYSEIPTLNIESCYLSLFKTKEYGISISDGNIPALSNLIMAYDGKDKRLIKNKLEYPTNQIIPEQVLRKKNQKTFIFLPLSFSQKHFGFILFEYAPDEAINIYEILRIHIVNTFKTMFLMENAEKTHKIRVNFFVNLAHETKTTLTLISNYLDMYIQNNKYSDELGIVEQNINKLENDMINFLDLEKLERGQPFYNHEQFINLSELIRSKIIIFNEIAVKKDIEIISNVKNKILIKIDPFAIDRILNNLLDNAIRYNKQGGKIEIKLLSKKNKIELYVKDTGIGIGKDQKDNIFKAYHQVTHDRNIKGIGMGMNIVKNIMESIGGNIGLKSKLGTGTEFKVEFKKNKFLKGDYEYNLLLCSKPIDNIVADVIPETEYDSKKYNVLVAEDNIQMLLLLQKTMSPEYNFYYAKNGKDALKKLEHIPRPNIIVTDIKMDIMDGFEFYDILSKSEEFNSIPFIFMTAKSSEDEKIMGLSMGAVDFIYKPFSITELLAKVRSLIDNQIMVKNNALHEIESHLHKFFDVMSINKKITDINYKYKKSEYDLIGRLYDNYGISKKEIEVIDLLKKGLEYKEIAAKSSISMNTVKTYIKRIYKKCGVNNKIELLNIL